MPIARSAWRVLDTGRLTTPVSPTMLIFVRSAPFCNAAAGLVPVLVGDYSWSEHKNHGTAAIPGDDSFQVRRGVVGWTPLPIVLH